MENMAVDVWEVAKERGGWKRQKRLRKERRRVAVFKAALGRDERRLEIHDGARGGVGETYGSTPTRTDSRRRASTSRAGHVRSWRRCLRRTRPIRDAK